MKTTKDKCSTKKLDLSGYSEFSFASKCSAFFRYGLYDCVAHSDDAITGLQTWASTLSSAFDTIVQISEALDGRPVEVNVGNFTICIQKSDVHLVQKLLDDRSLEPILTANPGIKKTPSKKELLNRRKLLRSRKVLE